MQVRKREFWNSAEPERLPDEFVMTKQQGDHTSTAVCECWVVDLGWNLRLMIDGHGLLLSSIARSGRELVDTVEKWKATMIAHGWRLTR